MATDYTKNLLEAMAKVYNDDRENVMVLHFDEDDNYVILTIDRLEITQGDIVTVGIRLRQILREHALLQYVTAQVGRIFDYTIWQEQDDYSKLFGLAGPGDPTPPHCGYKYLSEALKQKGL